MTGISHSHAPSASINKALAANIETYFIQRAFGICILSILVMYELISVRAIIERVLWRQTSKQIISRLRNVMSSSSDTKFFAHAMIIV